MSSFDSEAFAAAGQSHLLARLDQLSGAQAARFQRDLEQLDLPSVKPSATAKPCLGAS
jgi:hypothetical protein